jgi:hypothetical protein
LILDGLRKFSTTTNESGYYRFDEIEPGIYEVAEEGADGWNQTAPVGAYSVTLTDRAAHHLDFGNVQIQKAMSSHGDYPLMHPTPEQARRWIEQYQGAPRAYLSPKIEAQLAQAAGASYSLLGYLRYTPSERDQGRCGNCWAWAGTGVMEIDNAVQNGFLDRLSVQYLNSNFNGGNCKDCWACCGGWIQDVSDFYSSKGMAVPWSNANAQWQDGGRYCEDGSSLVPSSSISTNPNYPLVSAMARTIPTQGIEKETAISNIKNVLQQGKAIWFAFLLPYDSAWSDFFSFWNNEAESQTWNPDFACGATYDYLTGGGHAVLCVGYDDTDPSNRYWIMLNSWGAPVSRPNGLFRMKMDMDYSCSYKGLGYAFYWMTLDIDYGQSNSPPETPSQPSGSTEAATGSLHSYTTSARDPDGDKVWYTLDWGDGASSLTELVPSGTTAGASHAWNKAGTYSVKAMATDSIGASSGWSSALKVVVTGQSNSPPDIPGKPSGSSEAAVGSIYSYTTSTRDPEGDQVRYTLDWGDGSTSITDMVPSGTTAGASHAWKKAGTYFVKAMATDSIGSSSGWSSGLTVYVKSSLPPSTPSKPSGATTAIAGSSYSYSTSATDPEGDRVKYTFSWGDGSSSVTDLVPSGTIAGASHTWNSAGMYLVKALATDSIGSSSGWSSALAVTVSPNKPPSAPSMPSGSAEAFAGSSYEYTVDAKDPEGDQVKYTFSWGDGSSSVTGPVPSGTSAGASHAWSKAGTYRIRAVATDSKGAASGWSGALSVTVISNKPPGAPGKPVGLASAAAGSSCVYTVMAKDPDGDRVKYTFDWGDGTKSVTTYFLSGKDASVSHNWRKAGTYLVKAMTTDSQGASSGWSSALAVTVN